MYRRPAVTIEGEGIKKGTREKERFATKTGGEKYFACLLKYFAGSIFLLKKRLTTIGSGPDSDVAGSQPQKAPSFPPFSSQHQRPLLPSLPWAHTIVSGSKEIRFLTSLSLPFSRTICRATVVQATREGAKSLQPHVLLLFLEILETENIFLWEIFEPREIASIAELKKRWGEGGDYFLPFSPLPPREKRGERE